MNTRERSNSDKLLLAKCFKEHNLKGCVQTVSDRKPYTCEWQRRSTACTTHTEDLKITLSTLL